MMAELETAVSTAALQGTDYRFKVVATTPWHGRLFGQSAIVNPTSARAFLHDADTLDKYVSTHILSPMSGRSHISITRLATGFQSIRDRRNFRKPTDTSSARITRLALNSTVTERPL